MSPQKPWKPEDIEHVPTQALLDEVDRRANVKEHGYDRPVGVWKVTTEGDCEGRSTLALGTFAGHIVDIAYMLQGQQCYKLCFTRVGDLGARWENAWRRAEIDIELAIESNTWDMKPGARSEVVGRMLAKEQPRIVRGYGVAISNYYASTKLKFMVREDGSPGVA